MASPKAAAAAAEPLIRLVVQQIATASLLIDNCDKYVHSRKGVVVHLSFLKGADALAVKKAVKLVVNAKLSRGKDHSGKVQSVLEAGEDVLIVPQACLSGRLKGARMQYHAQVDKRVGEELYSNFVYEVARAMAESQRKLGAAVTSDASDARFVDGADECKTICSADAACFEGADKATFAVGRNGVLVVNGADSPTCAQRIGFGTYGNRQGLKFESDGPYSHVIEVS